MTVQECDKSCSVLTMLARKFSSAKKFICLEWSETDSGREKKLLGFFETFLCTSDSSQHDITGVLQSQFRTYNDCKNCFEKFNKYKNCLSQRPVPSPPPLMPPSAQEPGRRPALGCNHCKYETGFVTLLKCHVIKRHLYLENFQKNKKIFFFFAQNPFQTKTKTPAIFKWFVGLFYLIFWGPKNDKKRKITREK